MDRITRIRVQNVRSIEKVDVKFTPVTVLIGENGAGKSTLVECLELLRQAAEPTFFAHLYSLHRGVSGLVRSGAPDVLLGVDLQSDDGLPALEYTLVLVVRGGTFAVETEVLLEGRTVRLHRTAQGAQIIAEGAEARTVSLDHDQLAIGAFGVTPPLRAIERLLTTLRAIQVHLGFDTGAGWATQAVQRPSQLRGSVTLAPAKRLSLFGRNLANAWFELRNRSAPHLETTMALTRAGLGEDLEAVLTPADPGGGMISLALRFEGLAEPIPAANLSEGQLAWLGYVALARLHNGHGLLVVDEPEMHMHPALLAQLVDMLTHLDGAGPIVLATHSDAVLDMLDDAAAAVRVCRLVGRKTEVEGLDKTELARWLERYGTVGALRGAGYLDRVTSRSDEAAE